MVNLVMNGSVIGTGFQPNTTLGVVGTQTNDNATAGSMGEVISSVILVGSAVSLTTATPANITSISVTAGDWDIWGVLWTNPAGGTTTTAASVAISQTSATLPTTPAIGTSLWQISGLTVAAGAAIAAGVAPTRVSLAGTTTIYLVASVSFAVSTLGGYGNIIARRHR